MVEPTVFRRGLRPERFRCRGALCLFSDRGTKKRDQLTISFIHVIEYSSNTIVDHEAGLSWYSVVRAGIRL